MGTAAGMGARFPEVTLYRKFVSELLPVSGSRSRAWSRYDRPVPTLTAYDQLLTGSEG